VAEKTEFSATAAARPDDGAAAQAEAFRTSADGIRRRADLAAKTFGGLATTAVSAIGIAKFADVFPVPPGEKPWLIGLIGGFVVMLIVVGFFTYRLWRVSEPVVLRSSVEAMGDDLRDDDEKGIVIAKACADANGAGASNLPPICGTFTAKPADSPTAAKNQALKDLGAALGRCEAARSSRKGSDPCTVLQAAFAAAKKPG
jgi:hypothetical protein